MTSRRFSDRPARTRPAIRRGIKKRGILPSFGDIVLPIVSVAAVGLLVLAGRQFFLNGIKTSPGISSTRAYAEAPALIAEREKKQEKDSEVTVSVPIAENKNENTSLDAIVKQEISIPRAAAAVQETPPKVSQAPAKRPQPAPKPQPKPQPKKPEPPKKETKTSAPSPKQWRVQIGAYTSKAGAQEAVNKLRKAGYSATIYSNPASKHHKVWVAGGPDKKSAEQVVNAMKKLGYGSSFAFPPSK